MDGHDWYPWAMREAGTLLPQSDRALGTVDAGDALGDVWLRPGFVAERARWVADEAGNPSFSGCSSGPRAYLRRVLCNWLRDQLRRTRSRETARKRAEREPVEPDEQDAPDERIERLRECFEKFFRNNPVHGWMFYVTDVAGLRSPADLARETGLSVESVHATVRRVRIAVRTCASRTDT